MYNRFSFFTLLFITAVLAIACGRASQQADTSGVSMTLEPMSTAAGDTTLTITLTNAEGEPINDATLAIKGDMSHAGMEPEMAEVSGGENGVYTVPFTWTMGGDWIITVDATLPDGRTATQRFDPIAVQGDMMDMDEGDMNHSETDS